MSSPLPTSALSLSVLLLSLSTASAQTSAGGGRGLSRHPETTPFAIETAPGLFDLWLVEENNGAASLHTEDVAFRSLRLAGLSHLDRMRIDRPTEGQAGPDHIRLPHGGALYHVVRNGWDELLLLRGRRDPRVLFSVPDLAGGALATQLAVSKDGRLALGATASAAGGDVVLMDLRRGTPPISLTDSLGPLAVVPGSLRVSDLSAWFVANNTLYRALAPDWKASSVDLGLNQEEQLHFESLMAEDGSQLAVLIEEEDDLRRILAVPAMGAARGVTPTPGCIHLPDLRNPLGPFMAIAPDGSSVAYIAFEDTQELYLKELATDTLFHLTEEEIYPDYIDNVGVLSFFGAKLLMYLAGDIALGGGGEEMIAAADMYASEFDGFGGVTWYNVTHTSNTNWPPFTGLGNLNVREALLDPRGQRMLTVEEIDGDEALATFRVDGHEFEHGQPNHQVLLMDIEEEEAQFSALGSHVLVVVESEAVEEIRGVYLLQPATPQEQIFDTLAEVSEDAAIDRVAFGGGRASFVVRADDDDDEEGEGLETPYLVDLSGSAEIATPPGWTGQVSPTATHAGSGSLLLGLGTGPVLQFVRIDFAGVLVPLGLPMGSGFPLEK